MNVKSILLATAAAAPFCLAASLQLQAQQAIGPGNTIVQSQFGGQIFGFSIDQNGSEGVLSESQDIGGGKLLSAVETFDQSTGAILKVVKKIETKDDFVTLGVTGSSVALVEREHVKVLYVVKRIYEELNPLTANKFTRTWKAPLASNDIIMGISENQVQPNQPSTTNAVLAFENSGNDTTFVFGTNVGANTFGPLVTLTDPTFSPGSGPVMDYNGNTNQAVVAAATGAVGGPAPQIALADLTKGTVTQFTGILGPPPYHQGFVNGIAVDSQDGIACTTTELDAQVEFYNLKNKPALPCCYPARPVNFKAAKTWNTIPSTTSS